MEKMADEDDEVIVVEVADMQPVEGDGRVHDAAALDEGRAEQDGAGDAADQAAAAAVDNTAAAAAVTFAADNDAAAGSVTADAHAAARAENVSQHVAASAAPLSGAPIVRRL